MPPRMGSLLFDCAARTGAVNGFQIAPKIPEFESQGAISSGHGGLTLNSIPGEPDEQAPRET